MQGCVGGRNFTVYVLLFLIYQRCACVSVSAHVPNSVCMHVCMHFNNFSCINEIV